VNAAIWPPIVSQVGKTPSQVPIHSGRSRSIGDIGIQPTPWSTRIVLPTITTSTSEIRAPVTISILL
jgi:hypothetical protein